jgi:threonine dehydratase
VRVVAEPGGAAALAGLLDGGYAPAPGERVAVLVSGGNTTAVDFGGQAPATGGGAMNRPPNGGTPDT